MLGSAIQDIDNQLDCEPEPPPRYSLSSAHFNNQFRIYNFVECPYCQRYLHVDCFTPYAPSCWGEGRRPSCFDCEDEYSEYIKAKTRYRNREIQKRLREDDINFRLAHILRVRLNEALKGKTKVGSHVQDLGCTVEKLVAHLESLFEPYMSWDNYGKGPGKWNIDHIYPLSAFDLTDRQHLLLACHYLNLQPMWSEDNLRKLAKIPTFS